MLWACSGSNSSDSMAEENYRLEIVDSVQVDLYLSYSNVHDVSDETGNFLIVQVNPAVIYEVSPQGKVLKEFKRNPEDPEGVGRSISSAEYFGDGYAVSGMLVVKTYDQDFNMKTSHRTPYGLKGMIFQGWNHLKEADVNGQRMLLSFMAPHTNEQPTEPAYYEEFNALDLLDVENDTFIPMGGFAPDSKYRQGKAFYFTRTVFDTQGDKLFYTFDNDTLLYQVQLPGGEVINRSRIPFDEFVLDKGLSMGEAGYQEQQIPKDIPGSMHFYGRVDDLNFAVYTSGLKMEVWQNIPGEGAERSAAIRKMDSRKYIVFKDGKRLNKNFEIPNKVQVFCTIDKDGFIWANQNVDALDEEPELITFYKLRLVKD